MRYGAYIGRVGTLAVALGIGTALSTPLAAAEPDTAMNTSTQDDVKSPTQASDSPSSTGGTRRKSHITRLQAATLTNSKTGRDDTAPGPNGEQSNRRTATAVAALSRAAAAGSSTQQTPTGGSATESRPQEPTVVEAGRDEATVGVIEPGSSGPVTPAAGIAVNESSDSSTLLPATSVRVTVTKVTPSPTAIRPLHDLMLGMLGYLGFNPATGATNNPVLEAIWGLYRRTERSLDNASPTATGAQVVSTGLTADGQLAVTMTVQLADADGDSVRYGTLSAEHGTVTANADGTLTYLTDADYRGTADITITAADDTNFHLHGLFGIFEPDWGHASTTTVALTITENNAPIIDAVTSTPGTANTWSATVTAHDPDPAPTDTADSLTYSVTTNDPDHLSITGTGTGTGSTSSYTVTATDPAWATANPGAQVYLIATVTDGHGRPTTTTTAIGTINNAVAIGDNQYGQLDIPALPAGTTYTQIESGGGHTVLLRSDGTAVAVGNNDYGQTDIPALPAGLTYTAVAAGTNHTVLLRSDGQAIAIGDGTYRQTYIRNLPIGVIHTAVAAGSNHTVVLRSDGRVLAFYKGGSIGIGGGSPITAIATSADRIVVLRANGTATAYPYGDGSPITFPASTYTAIAAGSHITVLLRADGTADSYDASNPGNDTRYSIGIGYIGIAAGADHVLLLRADGAVDAFGDNSSHQTDIPALPAGVVYTAVSAGGNVTTLLTAKTTAI